MRIAMISTPFIAVPPRDYGGTELVVHELVEGLVERGHHVTLFATGDSETSADLRCLYAEAQWPPNPMADLNHVAWAMEQIRGGDFDIIHTHSASALAFTRLVRGLPVVYTLHHHRDEALSSFYRHYQDPHYVAISADQARREIPLTRLNVVHHGLNPAKFQWSARLGDYVCFVGRLAAIKGAHTAIDVAERAGVPIHVAGDVHPVDEPYANRELRPRLQRPHVCSLGTLGFDRKALMLREARALLMPIEWEEPFGLVMIEAMLAGCPVVAFPRGSVPEVVEPEITGFIVRNADEMVDIVRRPGLLETFDRRQCRERAVQRFSARRMVAEYEQVYKLAAASGDSTRIASARRVA